MSGPVGRPSEAGTALSDSSLSSGRLIGLCAIMAGPREAKVSAGLQGWWGGSRKVTADIWAVGEARSGPSGAEGGGAGRRVRW